MLKIPFFGTLPFKILLFTSLLWTLNACQQTPVVKNETPKEYEGEWGITKKIYSSGIEETYANDKDVYHLLKNGQFRRNYKDRNDKTIDEEGEWKIIYKTEKNESADSSYLVKRTPMFNGIFEEQFRIISKTETEILLEENDWGFENTNAKDKLLLVKK